MRKKRKMNLLASIMITAFCLSFTAIAEDKNGQPSPGGHAEDKHHGDKHHGDKHHGDKHHGKKPPNVWSKEKCQANGSKLKKLGEKCLNVKQAGQRKQCFDKMGKQFPNDFFDSCREVTEPFRQEIEAKEHEKYPNQKSAMPDGKEGHKDHHTQGPGDHKGKDMKGDPMHGKGFAGKDGKHTPCQMAMEKAMQKTQPEAEKCRNLKDEATRKPCFEKIHQTMMKDPQLKGCENEMESMKSQNEHH